MTSETDKMLVNEKFQWNTYKVGEIDEEGHGEKIAYIIQKSKTHIVYLNSDNDIFWNKNVEKGNYFTTVINKIAILQAKSVFLSGTKFFFESRKLLEKLGHPTFKPLKTTFHTDFNTSHSKSS